MALLRMCGFDYVPEGLTSLYRLFDAASNNNVHATISTTGGRFGGGALVINSSFGFAAANLPSASATVVVGFSVYPTSVSSSYTRLLSLVDAVSNAFHLQLQVSSSSGKIQVFRGNNTTLLKETPAVLPVNAWSHVEFKATIDDSNGAWELRVNGVTVDSQSSVDTRNGGLAQVDRIQFGVNSYAIPCRIDDYWVLNTSGSANNNFLGDRRIYTLRPNGAGSSSQFTPSAGSNFQCVDETHTDDDTTFVASSTAGHVDLYALDDLPVAPAAIDAVQVVSVMRKTDAGAISGRNKLKSGGTTADGQDAGLSTGYAHVTTIFEADPDTSAPWGAAGVNALEIGVEARP